MIHTNQRGMSAIPFIIMLILFLGTAFFAYTLYDERETARKDALAAELKLNDENMLRVTAEQRLQEVSSVLGWDAGGETNLDTARRAFRDLRTEWKRDEQGEEEGLAYPDLTSGAESDYTAEQIIAELSETLKQANATIKNKTLAVDRERAKVQAELDSKASHEEAVGERVRELERELEVAGSERDENRSRYEQEADQRRSEVEEVVARLEEQREEHRTEVRQLQEDKAFLEADISELKVKEERLLEHAKEMDGKVIEVDVDQNFAFVDLTLADGLRLGTRFDCIRIVHGNVEVPTGIIEVRKVTDEWAECNIVSVVDPLDPILPGDHVRNEIYDPERVREFAFAGTVANTRYSMEELGKLIESFGGRLVADTDITTDVVILGAGYENSDNYARAQELHLETLTENELLHNLGR
jgi:hypothetical protein